MSDVWSQTLKGRVFDLIDPMPHMVDFAEISETLSRLHRYGGASEKPVSVALHTLIACDAAEERDRAYVLLHDAHEAYIGDITTPAAHGLIARAEWRNGAIGRAAVRMAIDDLKSCIDTAILAAAGLPPPDLQRAARVKTADIVALVTERRDFLGPPPRPWAPKIEAAEPLAQKYRLRPATEVADELLARFKTYLPALQLEKGDDDKD